jgi:hypothetical protein
MPSGKAQVQTMCCLAYFLFYFSVVTLFVQTAQFLLATLRIFVLPNG